MRILLRWKWLVPAAVACALALSSATAASASVHLSQHWAGYAAVPKSGSTTKSFKDAQAVFTVPAMNGCPSNEYDAYDYQLTVAHSSSTWPCSYTLNAQFGLRTSCHVIKQERP
jgi:hypothetical protein